MPPQNGLRMVGQEHKRNDRLYELGQAWELLYAEQVIDRLIDLVRDVKAELRDCKAENAELRAERETLRTTIENLSRTNKGLLEEAGKPRPDSSNSGTSPSKNPPGGGRPYRKPEAKEGAPKRRRGGQIGHEAHFHKPFDPDDPSVDAYEYEISEGSVCDQCGSQLKRLPGKDRSQDMYVREQVPVSKQTHKVLAYKCKKCGKIHYGPAPPQVTKGYFFDIGLLSDLFFHKAFYLLTTRGLQSYLQESFGVKVSHSFVNNLLKDIGWILRPIYLEMLDNIKHQDVLNIDETTIKFLNKQKYAWAFVAPSLVCYKISTREGGNLGSVLTDEFKGVIGSDCYACYRSYAKDKPDVKLQLCLVHLKRDFTNCSQYVQNPKVAEYGRIGEAYIVKIFHHYHLLNKIEDKDSADAIVQFDILERLKEKLISHAANPDVEADELKGIVKGISERFQNYPELYFTFLYHPEIGPTNNLALSA
ncbi:MAG: transposase [Deltaproteobacteria bacterium]|nr:transposase [Deltaproteobacteria bacterium]